MESRKQEIRQLCAQFKLGGISPALEQTVAAAESQGMGFMQYTLELLKAEANHRMEKDEQRRLKAAGLPRTANLDHYDQAVDNGLKAERIHQLRELNWLDQFYSIVLQGPSGVGKTFIAAGLCYDAVKAGYKAYFRTMEDIVQVLQTKDIIKSQQMEYKKLIKANLIVLDDIMLLPMEKNIAVAFFNFINQIYESASIIITTNKKPADWAKLLDDEVLATALLDRLLYRCDIISLKGESYRMQNRKTFFGS